MRVMVLIKANEQSEAGEMPSEELLTEMTAFNEELVKAGVMLAGEGLHPSSKGVRVAFSRRRAQGDRRPVRRDQGAARRLLGLAGQVARRGDRVGQAHADPDDGDEAIVEIRPVFEAEDFGDEFTPELREREAAHARPDRGRRRPVPAPTSTRTIDAVWRIESARLIGGARPHRARRRPGRGPRAGGARRRAGAVAGVGRPGQPGRLAHGHRQAPRDRPPAPRRRARAQDAGARRASSSCAARRDVPDLDAQVDDPFDDDLLRLIFTACHPVLSTEARVALTLRLLGGLTTEEIARAYLVPEATVAAAHRAREAHARRRARAVRGARARASSPTRLASVLEVDLPDLQRGLRRDRRRRVDAAGAARGGAAARPHPRRRCCRASRRCTASSR